jgi:soluble lytic murein transglycosylase-like protein
MLRLHPDIYREAWIQSKAQNIDIYLLLAVWWVESKFNPNAVGDANKSFGMGQLYQGGAGAGRSGTDLLDLTTNAEMSAAYLAAMIKQTGSEYDGVSAYNQGLQGWEERGQKGNPAYWLAVKNMRERLSAEGVARMGYPELFYQWEK